MAHSVPLRPSFRPKTRRRAASTLDYRLKGRNVVNEENVLERPRSSLRTDINSVEISTGNSGDWRSRYDPRQRRKDFSSSLCVQTGSGAHPASCTVGTGGPFPGAKAPPGRDADHSHLVRRSRMSRSCTSSPPQAPLWRVVGQL
jgi:hypothetical protein